MSVFFSAAAKGFYDSELHNLHEIPMDAKPISYERHQELLMGQSSGKIIAANVDGFPELVDPVPKPITLEGLCAKIDAAADSARSIVAGDPLRAVEYERAAEEARQFVAAGYPADAVPPMVASWAIGNRTPQQAADNILAEASAFSAALIELRTLRLAAKDQIRSLMAEGKTSEAQKLVDVTISAVNAVVRGVGSAA